MTNNSNLYQEPEQEVAWLDSRLSIHDAQSQTFKIALQSNGDALIAADIHGNVLQMNTAAETMTGWRQVETVDQPLACVFRIVNEDTGDQVEGLLGHLLHEQNGADWTNNTLLIDRDGIERPIACCGAPVRNANGEITGVVLIFRDQTAERATKRALTKSEARFRDAFETSPFGRALTALNGQLLEANHAFADMLGLSIQELQEVNSANITHPYDLAESLECSRRLLSNECSTYRTETCYQHRNGHLVFADVRTTMLRDSAGAPLHFITGIVDISERKQNERALKDSEARYRRLFETAKDGILIVNGDNGEIVDVNPFLIELTGYSPQDFVGKPLWDIGPFKDLASSRALFAALHALKHVSENLVLSARDGRQIDVEFVSTLYPVNGQNAIQCNIRDVTEKRQLSDELWLKNLVLLTQEETSSDGILVVDASGRVLSSNQQFVDMWGIPRNLVRFESMDFSVQSMLDKVAAPDGFVADVKLLYVSDEKTQDTIALRDGRTFQRYSTPMLGPDGKRFGRLWRFRDITAGMQVETDRAQLEEQLAASQKMEAIGRLAGGVAHDFNNLLTVILLFDEFALEGTADDVPLKNDLLEIKMAAERAVTLTQQLLAFSRKQVLRPVPLDLNEIATGLQNMLQRIVGEDIALGLVLAPDLGLTLADPTKIEQVLMNLVVNARDAMPEGGEITIETSNVEIDAQAAVFPMAGGAESYVQLVVTDTGHGMDEQTQDRIFEPFFTTKETGRGTGLGLATVYGIVKQSGGDICVYSELGVGTSFKIYLPRELSSSVAMTIRPSPFHARVTGAETILLVEDDEALRKAARRTLEAAGYRVLPATDGNDALLISSQHLGDVHLLLTDVVMPRMSGKTLAEELSKSRLSVKVLYMSGYTDIAIDQRGVLPKGLHFIGKPFATAELTRKVREVLDLT